MAHRKQILVDHLRDEDGRIVREAIPKPLQKKFASYSAVVRRLEVGQTVMVRVLEGSGDFWVFMGYGEVTRNSLTGYTCPRRLMPEY